MMNLESSNQIFEHGPEEILNTAIRCGKFQIDINKLSTDKLTAFRILIEDEFLRECHNNCPGFFKGMIIRVRMLIAKLRDKNFDPLHPKLRILQNLHDEVLMALGEFVPEHEKMMTDERYMDQLNKYVQSDERFRNNASLTNLKIQTYVRCGSKQVSPSDDYDFKIVISKKNSYEENVFFILEHINKAIVINNQLSGSKMSL